MILDVLMEARPAGRLDLQRPGVPVFSYDEAYATDMAATPLSTMFPLAAPTASGDTLQWWLEGLLPDHDALLDSLLLEHGVDLANRVRLLGTTIGEDCAGAVQFCVPERTEALLHAAGGYDPLSDDEMFDWLRRLLLDPAYRPEPHESTRSFSLAGMQPKIALRRTDAGWAVPWGSEPSSHIIKVTRPDKYRHEALMEHIALDTAARMGILAARSAVITDGEVEAIVVGRYDRAPASGGLARIHQEDLCQALGYPPRLKYQHLGGPTPAQIAATLRSVDGSGRAQIVETFRDMLAFQWLIVGNDAHSKNYGLLLRGGARRLAPLYDACSWMPYRLPGEKISKLRTGMKIGRNYRISSADRDTAMLHTADRLGLPALATAQRFQQLASLMPDALTAAVEALAPAWQDLPIVGNYLIEQTQRAVRCEQVASRGALAALARRAKQRQPLTPSGHGAVPVVKPPPIVATCGHPASSKGGRPCGKPIGPKGHCGVPGHRRS